MTESDIPLAVRCERSADRWLCLVTVGDDAAATTHEVEVTAADLERLAPGAAPERLVAASFTFLLDREPRESILRRFGLPTIGRYFPEYEAEIRKTPRL